MHSLLLNDSLLRQVSLPTVYKVYSLLVVVLLLLVAMLLMTGRLIARVKLYHALGMPAVRSFPSEQPGQISPFAAELPALALVARPPHVPNTAMDV